MKLRSVFAVTLWFATVPAWGQNDLAPEPLPDLFSDVVDVRVVNVEVVVTDRKGNRVRGLQANDFELLVDGQPMRLDYFTEVDDGRTRALSDNQPDDVPPAMTESQVGTSYLIFIDDLSAIRKRRNRVLTRLEGDLAQLGPDDRVAIVAYDGRDLALITDWTGSPDQMKNALEQARGREARGLQYTFDMGSGPFDKTRSSVMAAAGALRSFASAPGRKVMLLLIDGWRSPYSSWDFGSSFSAAAAGAPLDRLYAPLVQAANLVGYSLYPVDLPGSQPAVRTSFGFGGSGAPSASFAGMFGDYVQFVGGFGDSPERRFHDLLQVLADETGGLPMINARSDEALAAAREDTRTWYWLGFEPQRNEDDRLHAVRVRLPGHPELGVRTRRNYLDMSRETEVSMLVEGALLLGGTPGTDALEVSFGTPRKSGFRKLIVPMKVSVPLDDVELLPVDGQWMTELEFQFSLIDLFGDVATPPVRKVPVAIPKEPIPGDLLTFETELQIRKRSHRYVATVRDPLSGQILSARGDVGPR